MPSYLLFFILLLHTDAFANLQCFEIFRNDRDYTLSNGLKVPRSTINHILVGDYSGTQLKSGMHTMTGLSVLLDKNPHLLDLDYLHPSSIGATSPSWMALHFDIAGASFVKLPEEVITRQGRNGLRAAHLNLQGAYLWKSLFPVGFNEPALIKALEDSVGKIDRSYFQNTQRLYTHQATVQFKDSIVKITILVDTQTQSIATAYPSGSQNSNLLGISKSGHFPMTRHMVTRLSHSFAIRDHNLWEILSKNSPPHLRNKGEVSDDLLSYTDYFESDYFGLPISEVAHLLGTETHKPDISVMSHYRQILNQMLQSQRITQVEKISFLKKAIYQIRSFGFDNDTLLFNLAIHDDIMKFAVKSLNAEEMRDFHTFYLSSPSYWYNFFPTSVLKAYLMKGRQGDLATVLSFLKHPQLFLFASQEVLIKPLEFIHPITRNAIQDPQFIAHWSTAYSLRVGDLKLNTRRPDVDFVEDRLNHLFLLQGAYIASRFRGTLENLEEILDHEIIRTWLMNEIINEYAAIASEFGAAPNLKIFPIEMDPTTQSVLIPHYEIVQQEGVAILKSTKTTVFSIQK